MTERSFRLLLSDILFGLMITGCDLVVTSEQVSTATDDLTHNTSQAVGSWYKAGSRIPVCVRGDQATDYNVRRARSNLLRTWQEVANVRFDEWNPCPTSGTAKKVVFWMHWTSGPTGGQAKLGTASMRTPGTDPTGWSVHKTLTDPEFAGRQRYLDVHEFGHILSFNHEMDNPENTSRGLDADCLGDFARDGGFVYPDTEALSGYDHDSVMNYCNIYFNGEGYVSGRDVTGARRLFGPALSRVGDINLDGRADVIVRSPTHLTVMSSDPASNTFVHFDTTRYYTTLQGGWFLDKMDHIATISNLIDSAAAEVVIQSVWGLGVLNHTVDRLTTVGAMPFGTRLSNRWTMDQNQVLAGVGDFNGDGRNELVFHGSNGLAIVGIDRLETGAMFVLKGFTHNNGSAGGWIVGENDVIDGVGDFDGDGRDELLIHSSWGIGTIKLAATGTSLILVNRHQHGATMLGGWDLDYRDTFMVLRNAVTWGRDTIIIRSQWGMGQLGVGAPAASTAFYSVAEHPWGTQFGNGTSVYTSNVNDAFLNASDFDGDGRDDLFVRDMYGSMVFVRASFAGFSLIRRYTGNEVNGWHLGIDTTFSGYGDFNGDGRAEVILRNDAGLGRFQLETGTPIIRSNTPANTQLGMSGFWNVPGVEIPGW